MAIDPVTRLETPELLEPEEQILNPQPTEPVMPGAPAPASPLSPAPVQPVEPQMPEYNKYVPGSYADQHRIGEGRDPLGDAKDDLLRMIDRQSKTLSSAGDKADAARKQELLAYIDAQGESMTQQQKMNLLQSGAGTNRIDRLSTTSSTGRQLAEGLGLSPRTPETTVRGQLRNGETYNVMDGFKNERDVPLTDWLEAKKNANADAAAELTDPAAGPGEEPDDPYAGYAQQYQVDYTPGDKITQKLLDEKREGDLRIKMGLTKDVPGADAKLKVEEAAAKDSRKELGKIISGMNDPNNTKPGIDWGLNKSTWDKKLEDQLKSMQSVGQKVTMRDPASGVTQEVEPQFVPGYLKRGAVLAE